MSYENPEINTFLLQAAIIDLFDQMFPIFHPRSNLNVISSLKRKIN